MTLAEPLRREGRLEGRLEGRAEVLTKLLRLKFEQLGPEHEALIAEATPEQMERYVERVLTAQTIDDVFEP